MFATVHCTNQACVHQGVDIKVAVPLHIAVGSFGTGASAYQVGMGDTYLCGHCHQPMAVAFLWEENHPLEPPEISPELKEKYAAQHNGSDKSIDTQVLDDIASIVNAWWTDDSLESEDCMGQIKGTIQKVRNI